MAVLTAAQAETASEMTRLHRVILDQQAEIVALQTELALRACRDKAVVDLLATAMSLPPRLAIEDARLFGKGAAA